jgi:hypothetical protein
MKLLDVLFLVSLTGCSTLSGPTEGGSDKLNYRINMTIIENDERYGQSSLTCFDAILSSYDSYLTVKNSFTFSLMIADKIYDLVPTEDYEQHLPSSTFSYHDNRHAVICAYMRIQKTEEFQILVSPAPENSNLAPALLSFKPDKGRGTR